MANDCSNRLQIHCDHEQILERIHDLIYLKEGGDIYFIMMKLVQFQRINMILSVI